MFPMGDVMSHMYIIKGKNIEIVFPIKSVQFISSQFGHAVYKNQNTETVI